MPKKSETPPSDNAQRQPLGDVLGTRSFTDLGGRIWTLKITFGMAERLRDELQLDLLGPQAGEEIARLGEEPQRFLPLLWFLCDAQAQAAAVSESQFKEGLDGDVMDVALSAFLEAIIDFFPPRRREVLRQILARIPAAEAELIAHAESEVGGGKIDKLLRSQVEKAKTEMDAALDQLTAGTPPGNSSATSAATPPVAPSVNSD